MENLKFSFLILALILSATTASAKICQLDWIAQWKSAVGILANSLSMHTSAWTDGPPGTWAVTSDQGTPGINHTVTGSANCSMSTTNPHALEYDNKNTEGVCWCRMTSPNLGAAWVLLGTIPGNFAAYQCSNACAYECSKCVLNESSKSCTRAAVLTLP